MECYKCKGLSIKHGKSRNGEQRYFSKTCLLSFQETFTYNAYKVQDKQIILLTKEGVGIRSTSRILGISPKTVTVTKACKLSEYTPEIITFEDMEPEIGGGGAPMNTWTNGGATIETVSENGNTGLKIVRTSGFWGHEPVCAPGGERKLYHQL